MKQSTIIFGVLLLAFVIYITQKDQLDDYLALFSPKQSASPSSGIDKAVDKGKGIVKAGAKIATTAAKFAAYFA